MQRIPEAELMQDAAQVKAYAGADFSEPHGHFIELLKSSIGVAEFSGAALDLGCGPGDITVRFARAFPGSRIDAVDGSLPMLEQARRQLPEELQRQIVYVHGKLPDVHLPRQEYDIIFSNSLLHHLPDPSVLWKTLLKYAKPGARIALMDLLRPDSEQQAGTLLTLYAANETKILQRDFYNSLLAAFTVEEIERQLADAGLILTVARVSDRHCFISGRIPEL